MELFMTIFVIGLILAIIMGGLSFLGDLDLFGGLDVDLDTDIDTDIDMDMGLDTDIGADTELDGDAGGGGSTGASGANTLQGYSFISPFMISFFLMGTGMAGTFIEESYGPGEPAVLYGGALALGFIIMAIMQKVFRAFFVNTQVNSLVRSSDFPGMKGVVTLRIREGDIGEVAVFTRSGTIKMAARSDRYLPEGTKVRVIEKLGSFLRVQPVGEVAAAPAATASPPPEPDLAPAGGQLNLPRAPETADPEFTFEAYRKREEAMKPTVIYDQRNINIRDSVINRSDFGLNGPDPPEERPAGAMKREMKKEITDEVMGKGESG